MLVVAISDPVATRGMVRVARAVNPRIHIIARTRYVVEMPELTRLGADVVIPEEFETSIEIFARVLAARGCPAGCRGIVLYRRNHRSDHCCVRAPNRWRKHR